MKQTFLRTVLKVAEGAITFAFFVIWTWDVAKEAS